MARIHEVGSGPYVNVSAAYIAAAHTPAEVRAELENGTSAPGESLYGIPGRAAQLLKQRSVAAGFGMTAYGYETGPHIHHADPIGTAAAFQGSTEAGLLVQHVTEAGAVADVTPMLFFSGTITDLAYASTALGNDHWHIATGLNEELAKADALTAQQLMAMPTATPTYVVPGTLDAASSYSDSDYYLGARNGSGFFTAGSGISYCTSGFAGVRVKRWGFKVITGQTTPVRIFGAGQMAGGLVSVYIDNVLHGTFSPATAHPSTAAAVLYTLPTKLFTPGYHSIRIEGTPPAGGSWGVQKIECF